MSMPPSRSLVRAPFVVYVDDDADRRTRFEHAFAEDLQVLATADAATTLALLASREPTAVLVETSDAETSAHLLRTLAERHPWTVRIIVGEYAAAERSLRMLDEGLAARHVVRPWQRAAVLDVVRWAHEGRPGARDAASLHRRLAEAERIMMTARTLVHDLKSPLMAVLANADHLGVLAEDASELREVLRQLPLTDDQRRVLAGIFEQLQPISEDLVGATQELDGLIECLRPLAAVWRADHRPAPLAAAAGASPTSAPQVGRSRT